MINVEELIIEQSPFKASKTINEYITRINKEWFLIVALLFIIFGGYICILKTIQVNDKAKQMIEEKVLIEYCKANRKTLDSMENYLNSAVYFKDIK